MEHVDFSSLSLRQHVLFAQIRGRLDELEAVLYDDGPLEDGYDIYDWGTICKLVTTWIIYALEAGGYLADYTEYDVVDLANSMTFAIVQDSILDDHDRYIATAAITSRNALPDMVEIAERWLKMAAGRSIFTCLMPQRARLNRIRREMHTLADTARDRADIIHQFAPGRS
jgi:hypothetical protein